MRGGAGGALVSPTTPRLFIETLSAARAAAYRAHTHRISKIYGVSDLGVAAMDRLDALFGNANRHARGLISKPFNRERFAAAEAEESAAIARCYVRASVRVPNYLPGFLSARQAS